MITLNNKKLAKNDKEFIDSLFHKDGTCVGYYKPLKNKVKIFNMQKELVGVITKNRVLAKASKQDNGKYWYSYGDIGIIGGYDSYIDQYEDIKKALESTK